MSHHHPSCVINEPPYFLHLFVSSPYLYLYIYLSIYLVFLNNMGLGAQAGIARVPWKLLEPSNGDYVQPIEKDDAKLMPKIRSWKKRERKSSVQGRRLLYREEIQQQNSSCSVFTDDGLLSSLLSLCVFGGTSALHPPPPLLLLLLLLAFFISPVCLSPSAFFFFRAAVLLCPAYAQPFCIIRRLRYCTREGL